MPETKPTIPVFASGKRYNAFTGYFMAHYGMRLQKVVIDAGFSCPNRDGTIGLGGCSYCNNAAFHPGYSTPDKSIKQQIDEGIEFHQVRYRRAGGYLAYFQPYSNTHAPLSRLKEIYRPALEDPRISGIVIGTRPDCMDEEKLEWFQALSRKKILIIEYGIESCRNDVLQHINRLHTWEQARDTIIATASRGIHTSAHLIIGLPGETIADFLHSAELMNSIPITGLKLHQLQIIKGTVIEAEYKARPETFVSFGLDEYLNFVADFLELLSPRIFVERIVGEVPPRFVNSTPWGLIRNVEILRKLDEVLLKRNTWQGRLWKGDITEPL